ncbi:MAG: hypothetical protein SCK70_00395 [bacterium]|nr:hypothetical protein [bacterium]
MRRILFFILMAGMIFFSAKIFAQVPRVINYQGVLLGSDEQPVPEGNYKLTFSLYREDGTQLWTEVHDPVFIAGGGIHVQVGIHSPLALPFDEQYFLGIKVGNDSELQPRIMLTSAAYSINADMVTGIRASKTPTPNTLCPLGSDGKFPSTVLPSVATGNFIKKNEPDTSRATSTNPLLLISNLGNGDGINGRSKDGIAVSGRSDTKDGIVGWTDAGNKSGVFGHSDDGVGVKGRSANNDGVVGYTAADQQSGVYGHTDAPDGFGVFGRNTLTKCYGYAGGDAGIYGHSDGVYHAGHFEAIGGLNAAVYGKTTGGSSFGGWFVAEGNYSYGIYVEGPPTSLNGCAARFKGNVEILSRSTGATVVELGEGLDYAEGFDVSDKSAIMPGAVLIIDPSNPGKLTPSQQPYDKRVAGIVAGAKNLGSGVKLGSDQFDLDVALAGRVYCNVDASYGAVEPGDLLTTSPTPGYAMVAKNHNKAQGAILGKAMEKLPQGQKEQILVLVTLQ